MKKTKLFKSLLLAAGMLAGSANAWAGEVSTIYTKALTDWTSDDVTKTDNTVGKWYNSAGITSGDYLTGMMINGTYGLRLAARNTTATATLTLDRAANTIVTIDAVWNVGSASSDGNTPHTQFTYGDLMIQQNVRSNNLTTTYKINGVTKTIGTDKFSRESDMKIHLKVNSVNGEISEFYIKDGSDNTVAQFSDLDATNNKFASGTNYDAITMLAWIQASSSYAWTAMKSITVQQEKQDVATASVTFKYVDTEGNSLSDYKADQEMSDVAIGTDISTLISNYNETFYNGEDNKYVFDSYTVTGDFTTVQADGNTVTLKFTDYPATAYTVKAKAGDSELKELASGTAFLDGSTSIYYSKYLNIDGSWYETNSPYGIAITSATTNISYTLSTNSYDFYWEVEDMTYGRTYGTVNNNYAYSNGKGIGIYSGNSFTSIEKVNAGYYLISGGAVVRNNSDQPYTISYSADGDNWTNTEATLNFAAGATTTAIAVEIPEDAYIKFTESKSNNAQNYMDYVLFKQINEMSIVGDFAENGWDFNGIEMTQSTEDETIWTAVVERFEAEAKNYEYKALYNGTDWYGKGDGSNQNFDFSANGYGAGIYTLTFTANTNTKTVEMTAVKQKQSFTVSYVNTDNKATLYAYTFNAEELGGWPGTEMTKSTEQVNGFDVYTITFEAYNAPKNIIFNNNGDWKTGDLDFFNNSQYGIEWPKVNITIAGYATYCSPYALDFSEVEGLKAYVAKINGSNVTFEEVTTAPAKTGLLLKAAKGEYTVKPIATATATESALTGVLEDTKVSAGIFVLMDGSEGVGFYQTTKEFTVGANTAYIKALPASGSRNFIALNFGDNTTTAIEGVATVTMESDAVFNLQGQRVNAAKKGLYIVNGKKMILK